MSNTSHRVLYEYGQPSFGCALFLFYCRLGYADAADVIELKGRVACEISSGDELLLTELIFNGAFNDLTVEQEVALLSCFVFQEKVCMYLHMKNIRSRCGRPCHFSVYIIIHKDVIITCYKYGA